jgi:hypothetical protein
MRIVSESSHVVVFVWEVLISWARDEEKATTSVEVELTLSLCNCRSPKFTVDKRMVSENCSDKIRSCISSDTDCSNGTVVFSHREKGERGLA